MKEGREHREWGEKMMEERKENKREEKLVLSWERDRGEGTESGELLKGVEANVTFPSASVQELKTSIWPGK